MSREFRVEFVEEENWIQRPNPDDQSDAGEKEIDVQFYSATICDEREESGPNFSMVYDEDTYEHANGVRFDINWDFRGNEVYLVVARFDSGSTFGHTRNDWEIHGVFDTREKAER